MKIAIVGTGYVGLVTGVCLADTGNEVICIDTDKNKIGKLSAGHITIYERGLEQIFHRNQREGRLHFTTSLEEGVRSAEIVFLALPTPPGEDGSADLKYILSVADDLGKFITDYKVIVDKSTVPVGTAEKVHAAIAKNTTISFDVVSNPEFLKEGTAVEDFMKPNRIIIGASSEKVKKIMSDLYAPFVRHGNPIIFMDVKSAELTKYAANVFLAMKISFMNEIAQMCERVGADVDMVRKGIGSDERIGQRFLFPGIGYGGHCFPKDIKALAKSACEVNYDFKLLDAVMEINEKQKLHLIPKIKAYFNNDIKDKKIALWGLAFKANTDDIREAPALYTIEQLLKEGAHVIAYDPEAMNNAKALLENKIDFAQHQYDALANADALVIATEWSEFRNPDFSKMASLLKNKAIFDGRNLFDLDRMKELGFYYESVGRKCVNPLLS